MTTEEALALHNQLVALQAAYFALRTKESPHAATIAEIAESLQTAFVAPPEFTANIGKRLVYTDRDGYWQWVKENTPLSVTSEESTTALGVIDSVWAWGYTVTINTEFKVTVFFGVVEKYFEIK